LFAFKKLPNFFQNKSAFFFIFTPFTTFSIYLYKSLNSAAEKSTFIILQLKLMTLTLDPKGTGCRRTALSLRSMILTGQPAAAGADHALATGINIKNES